MPSRRAACEKLPASKTAFTARIRELVSDMAEPPLVIFAGPEKRPVSKGVASQS
jgi:hypothetical protein